MKPQHVRLFVKTGCGWCHEAVDWLDERDIAYEEINVTANAAAKKEMIELTGQTKAPCLDVDGEILADFDTDQLAEFWKQFA